MESVIKIGCEIIVVKNNEILLGKRKNCFGAGSWGLPGGHLEYGEKLIDAAKRELEEETGISNAHLSLISIVDDPRDDQHYLHISFKLDGFEGNVELKEPEKCDEWKFFLINKLPQNIFVGHKKILESFKQGILYSN